MDLTAALNPWHMLLMLAMQFPFVFVLLDANCDGRQPSGPTLNTTIFLAPRLCKVCCNSYSHIHSLLNQLTTFNLRRVTVEFHFFDNLVTSTTNFPYGLRKLDSG